MDDDAIRDVVVRLSRPDASGGHTIERAVMMAEGSRLPAIVAWIMAHGGTPESAPAPGATSGLHSPRRSSGPAQGAAPQRYVLPAGSLN